MCGRGRCCLSAEQVRKAGKLTDGAVKEEDVKRINNFSPGMASSVVINNSVNQTREVQQMIFGLVPHFMAATDKPDHYKMFNARLETVTEKNSFKNLIARGKRCIVLFSGFYEWKTDNKIKQPHYVYLTNHEDNGIVKGAVDENQNSTDAKEEITATEQEFDEDKTSVMKIAGLYDDWKDSQGRLKRTYTTLTCSSCSGFQWLHSRQPVFLTEELADEWLDPECDIPSILETFGSSDYKESYSSIIKAHRVTKKMGVASYQEPDCHMGIKDEVQKSSVRGISNYFHSSSSESPSKKTNNPPSECSSSSSTQKIEDSHVEDRKHQYRNNEEEFEKLRDFKRQKIGITTEQDTKVDENSASRAATDVENSVNNESNEDEVEIVVENGEQIEDNSFICDCPLCGKNITALSASDRNSHVDRCCNIDIKITTPMKEPKKNSISKSKSSEAKKVTKGSIQNYFLSSPP